MFAAVMMAGLILAQPVVVDGDTLRDGDERYRVENLDAPETGHRAQCAAEEALGRAAAEELTRWVSSARQVEAFPVGRRDRYGRVVARVEIDGIDLGERLIGLGLAKPWEGRKADFCTPEQTAAR